MKLISYIFLPLFILSSCSNNSISITEQSEIGETIAEEYRNFADWTFDDFNSKIVHAPSQLKEIKDDLGFDISKDAFYSPKKNYSTMKDGGKRRLINWSKIQFKELKKIRQNPIIGKKSGDTYVCFEVICYEPEGNNTFSFIPFFRFDGKVYTLISMSFDW